MVKTIKLTGDTYLDINAIRSNRQLLSAHIDCVEINNVNSPNNKSITRTITRNSAVLIISQIGISYCAFLNSGGNFYSNGIQRIVHQSQSEYPKVEIQNNVATITVGAWAYAKVYFI